MPPMTQVDRIRFYIYHFNILPKSKVSPHWKIVSALHRILWRNYRICKSQLQPNIQNGFVFYLTEYKRTLHLDNAMNFRKFLEYKSIVFIQIFQHYL